MFYDPNYKNQIFWDTEDFSFDVILSKLKEEIFLKPQKMNPPKSKLGLLAGYSALGIAVLTLISAGIAFIITKSGLFTLVAGLCFMFFWLGWACLFIAIAGFIILPKRCNLPVDATCIGYSFSSSGNSPNGSFAIPLCPVFEYEYNGQKITAYDAVYENLNKRPGIGTKATIFIDPEHPEDLKWGTSKNNAIFLFLAFGFAFVLSMAIFFIVLNDDNFMNEALGTISRIIYYKNICC